MYERDVVDKKQTQPQVDKKQTQPQVDKKQTRPIDTLQRNGDSAYGRKRY
jgi:hypothetical protein